MAHSPLRTVAAFGLVVACGVAGAGAYLLLHRPAAGENEQKLPEDTQTSVAHEPDGPFAAAEDSDAGSNDAPSVSAHPASDPHHPSATTNLAPEPPTAGLTTPSDRSHQRLAADLIRADDYLRKGDLATAMKLYGAAVQPSTVATDPLTYFRWALCAETIGFYDEAAQRYQTLADQSPNPAWKGFAKWGLARVLQRQGRLDLAARVGTELWLTQDDAAVLWKADLAHWLGHLLYCRALSGAPADLLADDTLADCRLEIELTDLLKLGVRIHETDAGAPPPDAEPGAGHDAAETVPIFPQFRVGQASIYDVFMRLASESQWNVDWSSRAQQIAQARACRLNVSADPATILDALCDSVGLAWARQDQSISIKDVNELSADDAQHGRTASAARALNNALVTSPAHRWSAFSRFGLAQLAARQGDLALAQNSLEELVNAKDVSPVAGPAWYNLGKIRFRDGRIAESIDAFQHCSDFSGGELLEPIGNLYLGRLLVEAGQPRPAVLALRRAATLASAHDRPLAVITLASAHLAAGHPESANEVLRAHQAELDVGAHRDAAAFVSALSQVLAASDRDRRRYDQRSLMSAVSHVQPQDFFGWEGAALIVAAYRELGLPGEAADVARYTIGRLYDCPLRNELQLTLANDAIERRDFTEAETILQPLTTSPRDAVRIRANGALCELLLTVNRLDDAQSCAGRWIDLCTSPDEQSAALRLLGKCLERRGDRLNAALCFAGSRPRLDPLPAAH